MAVMSPALGASIDNGPAIPAELTVETEQIDVTPSVETKPDPKWTYTDPAGHFHAWTDSGELPTLTTRTEHVPCGDDDCCEGYDEPYYVCAICGVEVEPGTITTTPSSRRYEPGRKSWTVKVQGHVTAERVSVRIAAEDRTVFGIATPVDVDPSGTGARTTLVGVSPLGYRKG